MKHKIFVSIEIPEKTRVKLIQTREKWKDLPVKWVKDPNLHLTLAFLGFVEEEAISEIYSRVDSAVRENGIFDIEMDEIKIFPSPEQPQAIALTGQANEALKNLVNDLEENLGLSESKKKIYRPHITLGRIRVHKWEALDQEPIIMEKFPVIITADAVNIMASRFGEKNNVYTIVESCPLK
ncbi:MAG: RNA 2',3'-cyclic phosphodiesterase [Candidatus Azambacteria bacterium]|nr:RNA 2',3'-cyclic phosphodiesterase [Candidatus Azambacteria bacterium]